jgi:F420-dependent oxidoreductase-like protein
MGELTARLQRAADDGFGSAWMANIFGLDALTALAVAGNRVPGIEVGTAVVPTYPRHPVTLAQQALTTQAAVQGRLALGIGLSHQVVIERMFGYSFERPARHMREYLAVLLPLLRDGKVGFDGETVKAHVGLTSPREHPVPVLLAALGPQMLKLAGTETDGTVLWMTGPSTIANHIAPTITAAAKQAGRPAPRIVCSLPVCVTDDPAAALERAGNMFSIYGQLPSYRAMLDREGAGGPADVAIVGSEDDVTKRILAVGDAGATDFVAAEFSGGPEGERTRALLKDLARR